MIRQSLAAGLVALGVAMAPPLLFAQGAEQPAGREGLSEDEILERAAAIERRRIAVIDQLVPAVAAVFPGEVGKGGGSGVIIHPRGYLLTNFHVVKTERVVNVGLSDGVVYKADVLAIDPGGDIALARVRGKDRFDHVPLGDSDRLKVGERVWAMGNPFLLATDFKPTITEGLVSGIHRYRGSGANLVYGDSIQTDAAINPGNSGGPLFSVRGTLLGINGLGGFRQERGRFNVGVGFAASINQIKNFIADLRAGGQVEHGTCDATVREVPDPKDPTRRILVVDRIFDDSVAWKGGVRLGDRLLSLDGEELHTQNQFLARISRLPKGRLVRMKLWRDKPGKARELEVGFRLAGIPSGPEAGRYERIKRLAEEELGLILKDFAENNRGLMSRPWQWTWTGLRTAIGEDGERRLVRETVEDDTFTIEERPVDKPDATPRVWSWDGKVFKRTDADGAVREYEADEEAFAAMVVPRQAIYALSRGILDRYMAKVTFEGGDFVAGRHCLQLGVLDKKKRYVRLYLDMEDLTLRGYAGLQESGDGFAETLFLDYRDEGGVPRPQQIERRVWSSGRTVSRTAIKVWTGPANPKPAVPEKTDKPAAPEKTDRPAEKSDKPAAPEKTDKPAEQSDKPAAPKKTDKPAEKSDEPVAPKKPAEKSDKPADKPAAPKPGKKGVF